MITTLSRAFANSAFDLEVEGLEKLNFEGPAIIIPNHVSLLDGPLLATVLPPEACFVVNTAIAKKYKKFLKHRKHITINPLNPYSLREMIKVINSGVPLVIFPEGRITTTGCFMKIYSGVPYMAMRTGAKLYPVFIDGAERSRMSYLEGKIKQFWFPKIKITVGDSFTIARQEGVPMKKQKHDGANVILKQFQKLGLQARKEDEVNLYNKLVEAAELYGEDYPICKDFRAGQLKYKDFLLNTSVLSKRLEKLLDSQSRVGVLLPTTVGQSVLLYALFKLGVTPALLNFSAGLQNNLDSCENAELTTVLTSKAFIKEAKLDKVAEELSAKYNVVYIDDIKATLTLEEKLKGKSDQFFSTRSRHKQSKVILFTSGSESKPKGVVLTGGALWANMQQVKLVMDVTSQDKLLNALPMFHSFGLTMGTLLPLLNGISVYFHPSPLRYKEIPEIAYDEKCTLLFGTSTFLAGYGKNANPQDFRYMRYVLAGAEKLKDEVRDMWLDQFGIRIFEGYGATEASPVVSVNTPAAYKRGSVGQFLPGIEYKLEAIEGVDNGKNLFIKGPNLMEGYLIHGKGSVPLEDWYDCGDIVDVDTDGFLHIKSRLKRFAKMGGEMISLNLLEEIASSVYNDISFAAINVSDKRKGEKIVLYTTNKNATIRDIKAYITEHGHNLLLTPSKLIVTDKIPLLGSGKTDYVTLKNLFEQNELKENNE